MYLGLTLLLIGWAVWLGSASPWLIPPLFVTIVTLLQILPEEEALGQLFGQQYVEYRRDVARWLGGHRSY
jgi:protein-S-isoprenylcysteine O-methyltransferase Ste14